MTLDPALVREHLADFEFEPLFNEMGWEPYGRTVTVQAGGDRWELEGVAEKRGFTVFVHAADGRDLPPYETRRRIDRELTQLAGEHLIVYADETDGRQIWRWEKRELGKPTQVREHTFHTTQPGNALIQKLQHLVFTLEEEEDLTVMDPVRRAEAAFDVQPVTKKFYRTFKKRHSGLMEAIEGIPLAEHRSWYSSVMMARLMFTYFIQKKGFLDGDVHYLRNRLDRVRAAKGEGHFLTFYQHFLLRLFHEGLGDQERSPELEELLGEVPYVNGGMFFPHPLEETYEDIDIPDEAFERVFDFFDTYHWHLDERPLTDDDEINPAVLGHIFEKYVNQKELGAYYTDEDVTSYMSTYSVLPFLLEAARRERPTAFKGEASVWDVLVERPERYVPEEMRWGLGEELPGTVATGLDDPTEREVWNELTPRSHGLPGETWREAIRRRRRAREALDRLAAGDVRTVREMVTRNLDLAQFVQDVLVQLTDPKLLRAVWRGVRQVRLLDPACGSGAFLFAALELLEPVYEGCLQRMESFLSDHEHGEKDQESFELRDFREVLYEVDAHPNRKYFVLKSIIVRNLYGVDLVQEAAEICKLRMSLKLMAQVERLEELEPLPDIDFNVRSGNSLVGYATYDEVKRAVGAKLDFEDAMGRIENRAREVDRAFAAYRKMQVSGAADRDEMGRAKDELRSRLDGLGDELDRHLAREQGVDTNDAEAYKTWHDTHRPFHWFVEYYGILQDGGFDVVIGNPPYLESYQPNYEVPEETYRTASTNTIHGMFVERSLALLQPAGTWAMILPMSVVCTQRMDVVQEVLEARGSVWWSNYNWRPAKLFDQVNRALTIALMVPTDEPATYATEFRKWYAENRDFLLPTTIYTEVPRAPERHDYWVPKFGRRQERGLLQTFLKVDHVLGEYEAESGGHPIYYRSTGGLYWKVFTDFSPLYRRDGEPGSSSREKTFPLKEKSMVMPAICALSSDLFWWWYTVSTTGRDVNPYDLRHFPVPASIFTDDRLQELGRDYMDDLEKHSIIKERRQKTTGHTESQSFRVRRSKPIIDRIDRILSEHYDLSEEQLEFLIHYDIKFRIGPEEDEV